MNDHSAKLLERFSGNDWLVNCGKPLAKDTASQKVEDWAAATKLCKSRYHENVQTESQNVLTQQLFVKARERYNKTWNQLGCETFGPMMYAMIDSKVAANKRRFKISKRVRVYLMVDLCNALMELEYADIVPPKYFAERAEWYLAGHFLCGWDGDFPEGQLIVF